MKKYDVLVLGELNADLILNNIEGFPTIGTEILSRDMQLVMGSSSAIFACNLSVLGAKVAFLGKMGIDVFGNLVEASLKEKGVSTEFVIKDKELLTGVSVAMNYGEDRAMVTYPGAMESLSAEDVSDEVLKSAKHLHISSIFLQPLVLRDLKNIFSRAKSLGLTTSLDTQWDPSENWDFNMEEVLPYVDVFLPNKKEFLSLTRSKSKEQGVLKVSSFSNTIVIKDGANGSYQYCKGEMIEKLPFLNNQVIDCIGAGDSFNAGYIKRYVEGFGKEDCLEYGNLCGAVNTTCAGGTGAFRSLDLVQEIANKKFGYNKK